MIVKLEPHGCTVTREKGDPVCRGLHQAAGESRLLYHIKQALNRQGYDFVKKRMWKDGHMMDDIQQYLRERKPQKDGRQLCIYNGNWAHRGIEEDFNNEGETVLVVYDIGKYEN